MQEENGGVDGRLVVAFRGTQIGETLDCDADLCADALLWEAPGEEKCAPPSDVCDKFDDATLDYFAQAVEYAQKVMPQFASGFAVYRVFRSISHLPSCVTFSCIILVNHRMLT